ncbi:phage holin family protein [Jeotgalibacillus proteolyticus]|uniref:phage holin family protein n=1 Tax=Jeotgalibacillus proteolyticus TaxID=2082395 RepID=UPI001431D9F5|nr:phage holin family protein [Jeotgalibacillus proteolyticus]
MKSILALVTGFTVYISGVINEATVILVFFMFLDFISGMLRGWLTKSLNSTIGLAGLIKKFAVIVILAMTAGLEYFFMHMGQDTGGLIILTVSSFFIVNEGLSILENCAQLGLPIPPILYNSLEKLNRDPSGKEQAIIRDPLLDKIDKAVLLKEVKQNQVEIASQELKKEEDQKGDDV